MNVSTDRKESVNNHAERKMDIKAKIEELTGKIKDDPQLKDEFQKDPVSAIEKLVGVDLPNDQVESIVDGIKVKLASDKIGGALGGLFGKK